MCVVAGGCVLNDCSVRPQRQAEGPRLLGVSRVPARQPTSSGRFSHTAADACTCTATPPIFLKRWGALTTRPLLAHPLSRNRRQRLLSRSPHRLIDGKTSKYRPPEPSSLGHFRLGVSKTLANRAFAGKCFGNPYPTRVPSLPGWRSPFYVGWSGLKKESKLRFVKDYFAKTPP